MEKYPDLKILFELLNISVSNYNEIFSIIIDFETFKNEDIINNFYNKISDYKKKYNSNALTCLHKNSLDKQKFPAINFVRQILKCNNLKLKGYYICLGINKQSGKKILQRKYKIENLHSSGESNILTNPS